MARIYYNTGGCGKGYSFLEVLQRGDGEAAVWVSSGGCHDKRAMQRSNDVVLSSEQVHDLICQLRRIVSPGEDKPVNEAEVIMVGSIDEMVGGID